MSNRVLPARLMHRVKACAILFMASKRAQRIAEIAEAKSISLEDASIMYVIGALKRAKRQGAARNYGQALERLEAEQVGDRGSQITKTLSADKRAREINKINRINEGEKFSVDGIRYCHDYDQIITIDGKKEAIPHFSIIEKIGSEPKPSKVLGTLYAEWEERQREADPAIQAEKWINFETLKEEYKNRDSINNIINTNLDLFFADYTARLSKTAKRRLYELVQSDTDPAYLMGNGKSADNKAVRREARGARTLYEGFPHRESVTGIEFINLIRRHITPPVLA